MSNRLLALVAACALGMSGAATAPAGADDPARGQAFRSEDPRSDLDDGVHRAQPRLHDLRHAVRARRQPRDQAADGRQVDDLRRQAHLDLHPARRAGIPRRHAGHGRGRRALAQALGGARSPGADAVDQGRRGQGARSQDLPDPAQGADRHHAAGAGQAVGQRLHHAQARRRDRPLQADRGLHRLRPVHLREGRVEARRQDGLRQEPQVQAARRAALGPGRRQDRQGRPGRMGGDARPADGDERALEGRDRHHRDAAARPLQGHGGRSQHQAGQPQQVGQPVHLPLQPALQAVRQSQDPPGRALRLQPEGLPRRRDRRSQVLQDLQGDVHVRHAASPASRASRTSSIPTSPRPRSS